MDRLGGLVVIAPAHRAGEPGSNPGPGENFFLLFFNFIDSPGFTCICLTCFIRVIYYEATQVLTAFKFSFSVVAQNRLKAGHFFFLL